MNKEYLTFDEQAIKHLAEKFISVVPNNVSELSNDKNYITEDSVDDKILNSFYPSDLQQDIMLDVGGFKAGETLTGLTIAQILEKLLCGSTSFRYPTFLGIMDFTNIDDITYDQLNQEPGVKKNVVVKPITTYVHNQGKMFNKTHVIAFPADTGRIKDIVDTYGIGLKGSYHWKTVNFTVSDTKIIVPYVVGCNKEPLMFADGVTVEWAIG